MTKSELEKENESLKDRIKHLEQENMDVKNKNFIEKSELLDQLIKNAEFRKTIFKSLEKKLKKYDFLSPAISRAIGEMEVDADLLEFLGPELIKKLLIGDIETSIDCIYKFMNIWDNIEAGNGYPEGMQTLYFEGKFDKEE